MNWIKMNDEEYINLDKIDNISFGKKSIEFCRENVVISRIENTESNRKKVLSKIDMINSTIGNVLGGFK